MTFPLPFIHLWRSMKWGLGRLDCRECRICGRFEIWAYSGWHRANRDEFPDATAPGSVTYTVSVGEPDDSQSGPTPLT